MRIRILAAAAVLAGLCATQAWAVPAPGEGAPKGAKVSFVGLKDGDTVPPTFHVKFGLTGMKPRPASEDIFDRKTGHHHLLIDTGPVPQGEVIPFDDTHKHFGKGQTETDVTLPPGPHTLTLQFADGAHSSYGPRLSTTIHVTVVVPNKPGN